MSPEVRLDRQGVEASEFARRHGRVKLAAEFAAMSGLARLNPATVADMAQDSEERAVLACLARIHVDANKTIATRSLTPARALASLEQAASTLTLVHKNSVMIEALTEVGEDHKGREHHFLEEMKRDEAKTIFAAKNLYRGDKRTALIQRGEQLLQEVHDKLADSHPTKALIGIEIQLSKAARGEEIDRERLLADFERVKVDSRDSNPHRFATVAAWLSVWGERLKDAELMTIGIEACNDRVIKSNPALRAVAPEVRQKVDRERWQETSFGLLVPATTSADRRKKLHASLVK